MAKFLYLCIGGEAAPEDKREALMNEWIAYMGGLAATGKLRDGAPLGPDAKLLTAADAAVPYDLSGPDAINGYWTMEVADMNEALALTAGCPHYDCNGKLSVIEIMPM
jgi:hypothetical protein